MAKYHSYRAATSDGKEAVRGYSHKQMMKFLQDRNGVPSPWFIEQKMTEDAVPIFKARKDSAGVPITVTITHEIEEIDFAHEAQARGLQAVRLDATGAIRETEDKPYVKTYGVEPGADGKLRVVEIDLAPAKEISKPVELPAAVPEIPKPKVLSTAEQAKLAAHEMDQAARDFSVKQARAKALAKAAKEEAIAREKAEKEEAAALAAAQKAAEEAAAQVA